MTNSNSFLPGREPADGRQRHPACSFWRGRTGVALLVGGTVFLVGTVLCRLISAKLPFWNDEVFTYFFLADPSLANMWAALKDQINPSPPVYWLLGWCWAALFGAGDFSLRMFSVCGAALAGVFLCLTLARSFGCRAAAVSVLLTFFGCRLIADHLCEARFYPLFLASASIALWAVMRVVRANVARRDLLLLAFSQALLTMTHVHGVLFALLLLACAVLRQLWRGSRKTAARTAFAGLLGGMVLLTWIGPLRTYSQIDAGKPEMSPPLHWLLNTYVKLAPVPPVRVAKECLLGLVRDPSAARIGGTLLGVLILGLAFAAIWRVLSSHLPPAAAPGLREGRRWIRSLRGHATSLFIGGALLLSPVLLWLGSHLRTRLFIDRYCLPSVLGVSIVIAWLVLVQSRRHRFLAAGWVWLLIPFLALPLAEAVRTPDLRRQFAGRNEEFMQADFVLCESLWHALVLDFYAPRAHYYYILDEETALAPENTHDSALSLRTGAALRRHYHPRCILSLAEGGTKLSQSKFLVLDSPYQTGMDPAVWPRLGFKVTVLGPANVPQTGVAQVLAVEKVLASPAGGGEPAPRAAESK